MKHQCQWGPFERSRFCGTPHRKCQVPGCLEISLDDDDDTEDQEEPTMDIEANKREQSKVAADILRIWDEANRNDNTFTPEQQGELSDAALLLAVLVEAATEWERKTKQ